MMSTFPRGIRFLSPLGPNNEHVGEARDSVEKLKQILIPEELL